MEDGVEMGCGTVRSTNGCQSGHGSIYRGLPLALASNYLSLLFTLDKSRFYSTVSQAIRYCTTDDTLWSTASILDPTLSSGHFGGREMCQSIGGDNNSNRYFALSPDYQTKGPEEMDECPVSFQGVILSIWGSGAPLSLGAMRAYHTVTSDIVEYSICFINHVGFIHQLLWNPNRL
jgi:hypothetical protein